MAVSYAQIPKKKRAEGDYQWKVQWKVSKICFFSRLLVSVHLVTLYIKVLLYIYTYEHTVIDTQTSNSTDNCMLLGMLIHLSHCVSKQPWEISSHHSVLFPKPLVLHLSCFKSCSWKICSFFLWLILDFTLTFSSFVISGYLASVLVVLLVI